MYPDSRCGRCTLYRSESLILDVRLGTRRVEHLPIHAALAIESLLVVHFDDVSRFAVRQMHFVHLLFHVLEIGISSLGRVLAIIRVEHLRPCSPAGKGTIYLKAHQLIETLRAWSKLSEIVVIEGAKLNAVEQITVRRIEHDVDGIGERPVWHVLASENHAVAGIADFIPAFLAVPSPDANLGVDKRACVLHESAFCVGDVGTGVNRT